MLPDVLHKIPPITNLNLRPIPPTNFNDYDHLPSISHLRHAAGALFVANQRR